MTSLRPHILLWISLAAVFAETASTDEQQTLDATSRLRELVETVERNADGAELQQFVEGEKYLEDMLAGLREVSAAQCTDPKKCKYELPISDDSLRETIQDLVDNIGVLHSQMNATRASAAQWERFAHELAHELNETQTLLDAQTAAAQQPCPHDSFSRRAELLLVATFVLGVCNLIVTLCKTRTGAALAVRKSGATLNGPSEWVAVADEAREAVLVVEKKLAQLRGLCEENAANKAEADRWKNMARECERELARTHVALANAQAQAGGATTADVGTVTGGSAQGTQTPGGGSAGLNANHGGPRSRQRAKGPGGQGFGRGRVDAS